MKDNKPLYRVLIGTSIFIIGLANILMLPQGSIRLSDMTLHVFIYIVTGGVNMIAGAMLCASEFMEE